MFAAAMSTLKTARSMWSRPARSATARASMSWLRTPFWSSDSSSVDAGLAGRLDGLVDALALGEVQLDDHVLQEAAGADLPRGLVTPFQSSTCALRASAPSVRRRIRPAGGAGDREGSRSGCASPRSAAARIVLSVPAGPVQASRLSAPWWTRISRPSTMVLPARAAIVRSSVPSAA